MTKTVSFPNRRLGFRYTGLLNLASALGEVATTQALPLL